jgi:hypothetical protein
LRTPRTTALEQVTDAEELVEVTATAAAAARHSAGAVLRILAV